MEPTTITDDDKATNISDNFFKKSS